MSRKRAAAPAWSLELSPKCRWLHRLFPGLALLTLSMSTCPVSRPESRGDKTAIELFQRGVRMLASQPSTARQVLVAILDSSCFEQASPK